MTDPFSSPAPPTGRTNGMTFSAFMSRFNEVETEANGYAVICPSHEDSHPSLRIAYNAEDKKIALRCRAGCKTSKVVEDLGLRMADLFDVEPGEGNVHSIGRELAKPGPADRAALKTYLDRAASVADKTPAIEYAYRRFGVTPEKFEDLGLGYDDGSVEWPVARVLSRAKYHDAPRLVVPFNDFDGRPHYLQARALHNDGVRAKWSGPANPEGAAWGKFGFFEGGTGWDEVVITEGPGDGLTSAAVGYDTILIRGASLGTNAALADEIAEGVRGRRVVVVGDNDNAGATFARDVALALSERGIVVHRVVVPEGMGNDVTDWRESAGGSFSKAYIKAVTDAPRYGADEITVEEISQEITRLFSDVYNAKTLLKVIQEQGADVRFTKAVGFVVYKPEVGVWEVDHAEWTRSQAQTVAHRVQNSVLAQMRAMDSRIAALSDSTAREAIGKTLDKMRAKARSGGLVTYVMSTRGIDSMLRELRALPGVFADYDAFDQHPHLLAVENGIVNLEDGTLKPYGPDTKDLYLMRRIEFPYVKGARNPRWERFVDEVFEHYPDTEDGRHAGLPDFMQRLIGYGLTGHTTEQALAVFYGEGSNGKGVLIETLTGLFKGISFTAPFSTFEQKQGSGGATSDIAAMKGARYVMASEGEQGKPMAEALIKRLTGSDTMTARFLYQNEFEFVPTFLIILATNYKPNFRGQDYGLWRRVKLVPFTRTFTREDRDPHLTNKFLGRRVPAAAYLPGDDFGDGPAGILAWAVEGAVRWHREGLNPPPVIADATEEFKETSDNLKEFYDEFLVKDPTGRITGKDVWELYRQWCDEEDLPSKDRWKRSTFWKALEERGAVKTHSGRVTGFRGIRRRRPSDNKDDGGRATEAPSADIGDDGSEAPGLDEFLP